ncbi:breast carcinoma-amplified sequence 1 isoform X3 [Rhineura floridana]|uniref:breast carcinoma-amplified sequence 1 isoform X3 n=1 Tax=Rhineura floridana TaxID=261503 RepID=UPI002AC822DA|nr:breast carcinoma-amplified sequence 1 isoform X3 [Rhineura floridana]
MGNTLSMQREPEDQDTIHITAYSQVSSEPPENLKNGPATIQPVQTVPSANGDAVDARVSVVQNNAAVSSQKTMELSSISEANENNLGKAAKTAPPAAKSRFVFAFSRPVPGRTEEQATNSSAGSAQLDVSSEAPQANKALSENADLPAAAVTEEASDKNLSKASLSEIELTAPGKAEEEDALPKPKELTFFDRLFKVEKGKAKNKTQEQSQEEVKAENPRGAITVEDPAGLQSTSENVLQEKDVTDEHNQNTLQLDSAGDSCLAAEDLAQGEVKPENVKTAAGADDNNSVIMSFFKTLVSPSKTDSKGDSEDKTPTDDIEVITTERIEASPEVPAKDESRRQEVAEIKTKGDEKPSKTNLRKFFKLSVRRDAGVTPSEEVNGQGPDPQTLDFKDRPLTQAENREPVGEKSQESSTEKLNKQQENQQEARDQQDSREQETAETDSLQNGGEVTKANTPKRAEKKQSFGGFFKGLSPKRMSDAEVQTDPVSIVSVVKPK